MGRTSGPASGPESVTSAVAVLPAHQGADSVATLGPQGVSHTLDDHGEPDLRSAERGLDDLVLGGRHDDSTLDDARF